MEKKYLAQIIATDNEGLQMISACSSGAKVRVSDIKYLSSNILSGNLPKGNSKTFSNGNSGIELGILLASTSNNFLIDSSII